MCRNKILLCAIVVITCGLGLVFFICNAKNSTTEPKEGWERNLHEFIIAHPEEAATVLNKGKTD
jgi:hypothetical protein